MARLVALIMMIVIALLSSGCEWVQLQHQLTQRNINDNTNKRADDLSKEHHAMAPDDKKADLEKLRKAMLEDIAASERRAQEQIDATQAKIKGNIEAIAGMASVFGVPPGLINWGTGLALGQAVQGGTSRVAAEASDRASRIETSVKATRQEVEDVRKGAEKHAAELVAILAANRDIKEKFEAMDRDLQKKLTDMRGTMDDKIVDAFSMSKTSKEFEQRIKAILRESGLSEAEIKKLGEAGLPWETIAAILLGGGALGSVGGVAGNRAFKRRDEVEMHERMAGLESSVGLDGKRAKPYIDDVYEQIEAIKVALQGKGVAAGATAVASSEPPKKCDASVTINNTNTDAGGPKAST